jgi:hypothetical protein
MIISFPLNQLSKSLINKFYDDFLLVMQTITGDFYLQVFRNTNYIFLMYFQAAHILQKC